MADIFEDITLTWGDDEYVISGDDEIMKLIAKIENHITLQDLSSGAPKMTALASGYAEALRFAGASATNAEVYRSLFTSGAHGVASVVTGLLSMMVPPEEMRKNAEATEKKPKAQKRKQKQ